MVRYTSEFVKSLAYTFWFTVADIFPINIPGNATHEATIRIFCDEFETPLAVPGRPSLGFGIARRVVNRTNH